MADKEAPAGFNSRCKVCESTVDRITVKGILVCPHCDYVKWDGKRLRANPPGK